MWPVHFVRALPRLIPPPVHANLLVDPLGKHVKCQLSIVFIQAEPIVKAGYCVPGMSTQESGSHHHSVDRGSCDDQRPK